MATRRTEDRKKLHRDRAKQAVVLAMASRWLDAVEANALLVRDFPDDLEAYNRLGKALSELGRNKEAIAAFQRALEISPYNSIAKKNLGRLTEIGEEATQPKAPAGKAARKAFIEESGKTGVTSLLNVADQKLLFKMTPGHPVDLYSEGGTLKVASSTKDYLGQVEPRLASRLNKLTKGGNRYEAVVTHVDEREISVLLREVYRDPSQAGIASFPSRESGDRGVYLPNTILGYDVPDDMGDNPDLHVVKDWSNDDTEPGDDEVFSPVIHRIISADGDRNL